MSATQTKRERAIRNLAREQLHRDGELEIDDNAAISESEDNGAYVQAWVWLPFTGTKFDKEKTRSRQHFAHARN